MITKSHLPALLALYHTVDDRVPGRHLREKKGCSYAHLADLEDAGLVDGEAIGPNDGRPRGRTYKLTEDGERFVDAVHVGLGVYFRWADERWL